MSLARNVSLIVLVGLCGCATRTYYRAPASPPPAPPPVAVAAEEVDLVPPVPTFTTPADCEQAYGAGACGSGEEVFARASLAPPDGAGSWFIPYAYGVMTGVLVNRYFAPPTVFVSTVRYRTFVTTAVVERYRAIDRRTIEVYHRAPPAVRMEATHAGPVRFAPSRGVITSRPYERHVEPTAARGASEHSPAAARPPGSPPVAQLPSTPSVPSARRPPEAAPTPHRPAAPQAPTAAAPRPREPSPAAAPRPPEPSHAAAPRHEAPAPAPLPVVHSAPERPAKTKPCNPALPKSATNCAG